MPEGPVEGLERLSDLDAAADDPALGALAAADGAMAEHALEDRGVRGPLVQGPAQLGVEGLVVEVDESEDVDGAEVEPDERGRPGVGEPSTRRRIRRSCARQAS